VIRSLCRLPDAGGVWAYFLVTLTRGDPAVSAAAAVAALSVGLVVDALNSANAYAVRLRRCRNIGCPGCSRL